MIETPSESERTFEAAIEPPPPVQYAMAHQKEEIIRLLNHPKITRQEKTKMLLNINRFDEQRADIAITKLRKAIEDREAGREEMPTYQPVLAVSRTYSFYQLQTCAQREVGQRNGVYPHRVRENKMTQEKADSETEMMERIGRIMRGLSTGELQLVHSSGVHIKESTPGSFDQYIPIA